MIKVALYQIKKTLVTDETFCQLRKLNMFYLKELVRMMSTDATMRTSASENSEVSLFVAKVSTHLHAMANRHNTSKFFQ